MQSKEHNKDEPAYTVEGQVLSAVDASGEDALSTEIGGVEYIHPKR